METTVTGVFSTQDAARAAEVRLGDAGFAQDDIEHIDSGTPNRHQLIGEETSDLMRGAVLGAGVGALGMAIGGVAMAGPIGLFEMSLVLATLVFGARGAMGGLVIGLLVGSATGHQVQEEYEHMIDAGGVLLAVNTDQSHATRAEQVLAEAGGQKLSVSVHRKHHGHAQTA